MDAVLGSFNPLRLHMRLNNFPEDKEDPSTVPIEAQATMVHEYAHYLQILFTGFGQISWDFNRQLTGFLFNEWNQLSRSQGVKRYLPLAYLSNISLDNFMQGLLVNTASKDMLNLARARFYLSNPEIKIFELGITDLKKDWFVNPRINLKNTTHILQTKDITEGQAYFIESEFLEVMHNIPRNISLDKSAISKQYWLAYEWFIEICGEQRYKEFPIICDLAMQTSWEHIKPKCIDEWQDSHPAWRFIKLTLALSESDELKLKDDEEWPNHYSSYSSSLLNTCQYKSLEDIFIERLTSFGRRQELLELEKIMQRGMRFRIDNNMYAGNPLSDLYLWQKISNSFPIPFAQINGKMNSFGPQSTELSNEIVIELQFQAFAYQILGEFSNEAKQEKSVECAFSKFNISQGCEYQRSHSCSGRYQVHAGPPHAVEVDRNGDFTGCSFEALFLSAGFQSTDIDVDFEATLPTFEEIRLEN
ncbi:hypothetical protein [Acaryochloris marina]|uniref:hypothetical protein n=1 Tax=Acaryochloris marina TaxID=155978 RepID=UPI001BB0D0BF|nr:hypothetical protein [Acaryochloris marina]QUY45434.1 hypothetical protein I1H34_27010 [Acaryochloris marina S15]